MGDIIAIPQPEGQINIMSPILHPLLVGGCLCLIFITSVNAAKLVKHDARFVPDTILRVSVGIIQLNCQPRLSTLVNGTYPGPTIYLEPGVTTWIRVFNDANVNTTMVG